MSGDKVKEEYKKKRDGEEKEGGREEITYAGGEERGIKGERIERGRKEKTFVTRRRERGGREESEEG